MFVFNNREYEKVFFTSDQHFGSDRHILFSGRYDFSEDLRQAKIRKVLSTTDISKPQQKILKNSYYGLSLCTHVDEMNNTIINR